MRVLMLDFDGLQPAYLGPFGCEWVPTPTWDRLAVAGVVFDKHFADCPDPTAKLSWRSGQHPMLAGASGMDLLKGLRAAGVRTARVGPTAPADGWEFEFAAKRSATEPLALNSSRRAVRAAIEQIGDAPNAFLRIEIDALLPPWRPSEAAWTDCFGDAPEGNCEPWTGDLPDRIDLDDDETFERIQNTYAAALATLDVSLGKLLADCSRRGWGDDTLWILTASRGFPLGEHGEVGFRNADVHEELVHLPLLLRLPGGDHGGSRVSGFTQPIDIAVTLRELFGLPALATANCSGRNLTALADAVEIPALDHLVSGLRDGDQTRWGYRTAGWYLMLGDQVGRRLFVKPDDRWEVNDVAARNQELAEELEAKFRQGWK